MSYRSVETKQDGSFGFWLHMLVAADQPKQSIRLHQGPLRTHQTRVLGQCFTIDERPDALN